MKKYYIFVFSSLIFLNIYFTLNKNHEFVNIKNKIYFTNESSKENLDEVQCPIPKEDRVLNKTEIQCVWASIEMLGRWAEEEKLINPPLTSRNECKSYSSPSDVNQKLTKLNVKFKQSYRNEKEGIELIKEAMKEKRGCLWSVPGHAMVIVHFDEEKDIFKWVDNSDLNLNIQTSDIAFFERNWESWVLVIYGDYSKIENKIKRKYNIPMFEKNKQILYDKDYIDHPNNSTQISF